MCGTPLSKLKTGKFYVGLKNAKLCSTLQRGNVKSTTRAKLFFSHEKGDVALPQEPRGVAMRSMQNETNVQAGLGPTRSAQMIACLRDSMLYSEKRARDMLFQALEQVLAYSRCPANGVAFGARIGDYRSHLRDKRELRFF